MLLGSQKEEVKALPEPFVFLKTTCQGFPGGTVDMNPPANVGDMGLIPGSGRFHVPQGNQARVLQLLSLHSRVCALQQEKSWQ